MANVEESIEVDVPVRTAYDQWTQFQEFPQFMEGVEEVRQLDDTHLHWRTRIAGREKSFRARVTEQVPDERIAWTSEEGARQGGVVTFHRLADGRTRIMLQLVAEPEGLVEKAGDALGLLKRRITGDLENFKRLIESRGREDGAWRGEVRAHGQESGARRGEVGAHVPESEAPRGEVGAHAPESEAPRGEVGAHAPESEARLDEDHPVPREEPSVSQVEIDQHEDVLDETPLEVSRRHLEGLQFPATKEEVLETLQSQGAPDAAVEKIRSKHHSSYSSAAEVMVYLRELY